MAFIEGSFKNGPNHGNWKGGRYKRGIYFMVSSKSHPRANKYGYVFEHIIIAESALGKTLPKGAVVHHHTPEQLVVCESPAYHQFLHRRTRAYRSAGNVNYLRCSVCKKYKPPEDFYNNACKDSHKSPNCKLCHNLYQKNESYILKNSIRGKLYWAKNREEILKKRRDKKHDLKSGSL